MSTLRSAASWGEVTLSGPFFGAGSELTDQVAREVDIAIATYAAQRARARMAGSFKHGRGEAGYIGKVVVDLSNPDLVSVTDQGVVYGPWLEGTSSRNKTTRFKGYKSFRLAKQDADAKATDIAGEVIAGVLRKFN